jgi:hypothetical protein
MEFATYEPHMHKLRYMVKETFLETRPRNWKYMFTDILEIKEVTKTYMIENIPSNAVAFIHFGSKYAPSERGGWDSHNEFMFLNNDGTFTAHGYDTILSKVIPGWIKVIQG